MKRIVMTRIQRVLWYATTLSTGILTGFLVSHSVMLGRFFTWLIKADRYDVFEESFSVFRLSSHANVHYNLFLVVALVIGVLYAAISLILRKDRPTALLAGLSTLWVSCVFFISRFSDAEAAVASGVADQSVRDFFVAWNLPMHSSFAIFYAVCFLLLLRSGMRQAVRD